MKKPIELLRDRLEEIKTCRNRSVKEINTEDTIELMALENCYEKAIKAVTKSNRHKSTKEIIQRRKKIRSEPIKLKGGGTINRISMNDYKY